MNGETHRPEDGSTRTVPPRSMTSRTRRRSGSLLVVAVLITIYATFATASAQDERPMSACEPPPFAAPNSELTPDELGTARPSDAPAWSEGRWRTMAPGPFGTAYAPATWTGNRLLVVDRDTGRTATYRPDRDRWREVATAPRRVEPDAPFVWTGTELVISDMSRDASTIRGLAYDPGRDRWRELPRLPFESSDRDNSITAATWTGTHVVVAEGLGLIAAYDPAADCWTELGRVPSEQGFVWHLYQNGPRLLVESRTPDDVVAMRSFDLASGEWSDPAVAPLDRRASESGGVWMDGSLVYVTWRDASEYDGAANAVFDPSTMSWSVFEHHCTTRASRTIEANGSLIASDGRRALDPETLTCIDIPKAPRTLNGTEATVWTGSELIAWSGIRSLPEPPRRGGLVFEPKERTE